ncbi:FtsX-like permease family protein [Streptomyces erythrochromogenes]|uniref:FtsX-like permease family protein n=1 Tax=Streptomyces erythrochromogenes TaxID=285574 RepID=UPI0034437551
MNRTCTRIRNRTRTRTRNHHRRLAWTLGRRLASRSRLRTLLVCLAIALPVAAGTGVAAVTATARVSMAEAEAAAFGAADGRLTTLSGEWNADATAPAGLAERLRPSLPEGTRLAYDIDVLGLTIGGPHGRRSTVDGRAVDLADPLAAGLYRIDRGAPSAQDGTIVLSSALADAVGITATGQSVTIGSGRFTVSALVSDRFDLGHRLFALPPGGPGTAAALASAKDLGSPRWFVAWPPRADRPAAAGTLKNAGYAYVPSSQAAVLSEQDDAMDSTALLVGLGLLAETVLLVTAAFAVVVRSQRRHMGLLAALGAPARVTASFLRTHALCVAVTGSLAGLAAGQAVARVSAPVLAERAGADWGPVDGAWATSLVLAAVAAGVTVLASVLPSRAALREDPTALLKAVPPLHGTRRLRLRTAAAGTLTVATVAGLTAVVTDSGALTAALGVIAFTAGITATVLGLSSLAARWANTPYLPLPTALRSALRSLLAFPVRAIATVIALGTVAAVSTTVLIASASVAHEQREGHLPDLPDTSALIVSSRPLTTAERDTLRSSTGAVGVSTGYQRAVIARDGRQLPVSPRTDFLDCIDDRGLLKYGNNDWQPCYRASRSHIPFPAVGIADSEGAEALAGAMTDVQRQRYESGEAAVAVTPVGLGSEVSLVAMGRGPDGFVLESTATLPLIHPSAARATQYQQLPAVLLSRAGARKSGAIPAGAPTYLLDADTRPAQQDVLRAIPVDAQADSAVAVESGPSVVGAVARLQPAVAAVSVLTTMLIVAAMTGLWTSDLRGEYRMLGAVGATTWWRRRLASSMSGLLVAVSCVVGTAWGAAASVAFLTGMDTGVAVPAGWLVLTVLAAVTTAAVMGGALVPRHARAQRRA